MLAVEGKEVDAMNMTVGSIAQAYCDRYSFLNSDAGGTYAAETFSVSKSSYGVSGLSNALSTLSCLSSTGYSATTKP